MTMDKLWVLTEQIPSGKNQQEEVWIENRAKPGTKRKILRGNKRFQDWRILAAAELRKQIRAMPRVEVGKLPLKGRLRLSVWYRELVPVPAGGTRDLPGMEDAIFHLLEVVRLVGNDGQIQACAWEPVTNEFIGHTACVIFRLEAL